MPLNNYQIKLLAAAFMLVDHIGAVFFPQILAFRAVGRLSFPLFAWLIAQGESHTRSIGKYAGRLFLFGIVTQPVYRWLFDTEQLNVLFTLLIGLLAIRLGKNFPTYRYLIWAIAILISSLIPMDAGSYGVITVLLMAALPLRPVWWGLWLGLHLLYVVILQDSSSVQLFAVFAPLFVWAANLERGQRARWFYLFYPGHLVGLLLIEWWLHSGAGSR
ncbi:MAG: TraX family protein [Synechococcales bacterium]|nr:TraX family protein [Synechococcales bacterium]